MAAHAMFRQAIGPLLVVLAGQGASAHDGEGASHRHIARNPAATVSITVEGTYRYLRGNGLPDHATGDFPNAGNPNRIRPQHYDFRVPRRLERAGRTLPLGRYPFGVAVNGVIFDPGTAGFWNRDPASGWRMDALGERGRLGLDDNNAHVQPNGAYHYHGVPTGLLRRLGNSNGPVLIGYAADGFPMYGPTGYSDAKDSGSGLGKLVSSYRLKAGMRPGGPGGAYDGSWVQDYEYIRDSGDLDDCNGRFGVTPEYPDGTYYYVVTEEFPGVPRCFKGEPDESFTRIAERRRHRTGPGPLRAPHGPRRPGPQNRPTR